MPPFTSNGLPPSTPAPQPSSPQMPPQMGAGGQQGGPSYPPQFLQHIAPNNQLQATLLQRMDAFTREDVSAIAAAEPEVIAAFKKLLPEVGFVLDAIASHPWQQDGSGGEQDGEEVVAAAEGDDDGEADDGNADVEEDDEQGESPPPPPGATPLRPAGTPKTKLNRF